MADTGSGDCIQNEKKSESIIEKPDISGSGGGLKRPSNHLQPVPSHPNHSNPFTSNGESEDEIVTKRARVSSELLGSDKGYMSESDGTLSGAEGKTSSANTSRSGTTDTTNDAPSLVAGHSLVDESSKTPTHIDDNNEELDENDDNSSDISDLSDLDDDSCISGPMGWIRRQISQGLDPRTVLGRLAGGPVADIPQDVDDISLWMLIRSIIAEPSPRKRLPGVSTIEHVVELMRRCSKIMVLTGAGVSVSCGIPDFRSRNGIYARLAVDYPDLPDPHAMFDIRYFRQNPLPFFKFAKEIYPGQFQPSVSHRFIELIERHGRLLRNYTQNIDTLEQVAGIKRVIQCHGSFAHASCMVCRRRVSSEEVREDIMNQVIPRCTACGPEVEQAIMKPDIVFFGENLPEEFHDEMDKDRDECDMLIVIGSSLKVRPVALIPSSLPAHVPQVLINREPLRGQNFDVELLGDCDVVVSQLCHMLGPDWSSNLSADFSPASQVYVDELVPLDTENKSIDESQSEGVSDTEKRSIDDTKSEGVECTGKSIDDAGSKSVSNTGSMSVKDKHSPLALHTPNSIHHSLSKSTDKTGHHSGKSSDKTEHESRQSYDSDSTSHTISQSADTTDQHSGQAGESRASVQLADQCDKFISSDITQSAVGMLHCQSNSATKDSSVELSAADTRQTDERVSQKLVNKSFGTVRSVENSRLSSCGSDVLPTAGVSANNDGDNSGVKEKSGTKEFIADVDDKTPSGSSMISVNEQKLPDDKTIKLSADDTIKLPEDRAVNLPDNETIEYGNSAEIGKPAVDQKTEAGSSEFICRSVIKKSIAMQLKDNTYLYLPARRYVFTGAELYNYAGTTSDDDSSSESSSCSSVDDDDDSNHPDDDQHNDNDENTDNVKPASRSSDEAGTNAEGSTDVPTLRQQNEPAERVSSTSHQNELFE